MKPLLFIVAILLLGYSNSTFASRCYNNNQESGTSIASPVLKLTLSAAKDSLWLGEMSTGYLGAVTEEMPDQARRLLGETNAARKSKYKKTSKENKMNLKLVVEKAGIRNLRKTHAGHYIHVDGAWKIKVEEAE
jgi:uncharacterized protein YdbL (DUF1318 family)